MVWDGGDNSEEERDEAEEDEADEDEEDEEVEADEDEESETGIVNSNDFLFIDISLLLINFGKIECTSISVINIVSDIVNGSL